MKEINYPKIWGQGSIFASSGLETTTTATNSLVGSFLADRIGFEFKTPIRVYFYFKFNRYEVKDIDFDVITSDLVKGSLQDKDGKSYEIIISFWSEQTATYHYSIPNSEKPRKGFILMSQEMRRKQTSFWLRSKVPIRHRLS